MIISPYSIYNYIVGLPENTSSKILMSLKENLNSLKFTQVLKDNPKNIFVRVYNNDKINFLFKQSRINIPQQNWKLKIEAEYYKIFNSKSFIIDNFFFEDTSNALVLPIYYPSKFEYFKVGILLNSFHSQMDLRNLMVKKFKKNTLLNNGTPYTRFIDILKLSKKNKSVLIDLIFPQKTSGKNLKQQEIVIDFLCKNSNFDFLIDLNFRIQKIKTHIIHGDFRTENILFLTDSQKIIDFEYVCEGHPMWDVANILESILSSTEFQSMNDQILNDKFQFLVILLKKYRNTNDLSLSKFEIADLIDFWILTRIMKLSITTFDFLLLEIETIQYLIKNRNSFLDQIIIEKLTDKKLMLSEGCNYDLYENN